MFGRSRVSNDVLTRDKITTKLMEEELKRQIKQEELHISSTRGGSIPGTHLVCFDGPVDTIELKHTARGREGFAEGAVTAAEWIENKTGFYNISKKTTRQKDLREKILCNWKYGLVERNFLGKVNPITLFMDSTYRTIGKSIGISYQVGNNFKPFQ